MNAKEEETPSVERMRELLVGKSITKVELIEQMPKPWWDEPYGLITLSDGMVLKIWGNTGGCACGAGDYPLTELNPIEGVITNVEIETVPDEDFGVCPVCKEKYCATKGHRGYYRIFVVAEDKRLTLASFEGTDGNGYYGTGWWLLVEKSSDGQVIFGL